MGGWPTFWRARDRQSTSLGDNFFISSITTPLKFNVWYTTTMEITRSGDSMFITKFEGKDAASNSFTTNNKIFIGKVTSIHYAKNVRLAVLADDLINWVEIISKKYSCDIVKKTVPKTCVNTKNITLFDYFTVEGRTPTDSNSILKVTQVSSTGTGSLLNKTLARGIFPKSAGVGTYTVKIITRCGTEDSFDVEILPNYKEVITLSDSVLCPSKSLLDGEVKSSTNLDSITKAVWTYSSSTMPNTVATGQKVNLDFKGKIGSNKITLITTTKYGCVDTFIKWIQVLDTSNINFQFTNRCFPENIELKFLSNKRNSYIKNINWDFSDGTTSSGYSVIKSVLNPGNYSAKVSVIDSMGCTSVGTVYFKSFKNLKVSFIGNVSYLSLDKVAVDFQYIKEDSVNYWWQSHNGTLLNGKTPFKDTLITNTKFCYKLIGTTVNNCSDTLTKCYNKGLYIDPISNWCYSSNSKNFYSYIHIENSIAADTNCTLNLIATTNDSVKPLLGMKFNNGTIPPYFPCGSHKIKLTLKDGRTDSFNIIINCNPKVKINTTDTQICKNAKLFFNGIASSQNNDTSQINFIWKFNNQTISVNGSTVYNIPLGPEDTLIKLIGLDKISQCIDSVTFIIKSIDTPSISSKVNSVCFGEISDSYVTGVTSPSSINSWLWEISDGSKFNTKDWNQIFPNSGKYSYNLTVVSKHGCITKNPPTFFEVYPLPIADFSITIDSSSYNQYSIELNYIPTLNDNIYWSSDVFGNIINQSKFRFNTNRVGDLCYKLNVINQYKCNDSVVKCHTLESKQLEEIYIPNTFTPNNSELNDEFKPFVSHRLGKYKLKIYNKWGELIFVSENQENGWNGIYMDKQVPDGSYIFTISGRFPSGNAFYKNGVIQLFKSEN